MLPDAVLRHYLEAPASGSTFGQSSNEAPLSIGAGGAAALQLWGTASLTS